MPDRGEGGEGLLAAAARRGLTGDAGQRGGDAVGAVEAVGEDPPVREVVVIRPGVPRPHLAQGVEVILTPPCIFCIENHERK